MHKDPSNFESAISQFNSMHREDPETVVWHGSAVPRACLYHERLNHWVEYLDPDASEALRLAACCQHLRRWVIPRTDYPDGLTGYRRWRSVLTDFHVQEASLILRELDYDDATKSRVLDFLIKKNLKRDPEMQLFEDAICLVFFETELTDFSGQHDRDKVIRISRKVWKKMSENGREAAQQIVRRLPAGLQDALDEAIAQVG
jgi:hypothetical protein